MPYPKSDFAYDPNRHQHRKHLYPRVERRERGFKGFLCHHGLARRRLFLSVCRGRGNRWVSVLRSTHSAESTHDYTPEKANDRGSPLRSVLTVTAATL